MKNMTINQQKENRCILYCDYISRQWCREGKFTNKNECCSLILDRKP